MATFDSTKTTAKTVTLNRIVEGKLQLPDFQRGWVWDDSHIKSLLVSIARSFPNRQRHAARGIGGATKFQSGRLKE